MSAKTTCLVTAFLAACAAHGEYLFETDFSVEDSPGEVAGVDVIRTTRYSHGHGQLRRGGGYAITLHNNVHELTTPALADFRLEADWAVEPFNVKADNGFRVLFRHDRDARSGHEIVFRRGGDGTLEFILDGDAILSKGETSPGVLSGGRLTLDVRGERGVVEAFGERAEFRLKAGFPARGRVAFDAICSSSMVFVLKRVSLASPDETRKKRVASWRMVLKKTQGFQSPLVYDVALDKHEDGTAEVSCRLTGGVRDRGPRIETHGQEWVCVRERLTAPYLRFDFPDGTSRTFRLYDGMRTLLDSHMADVPNWSDAHEKPDPWPAEGLRLWRGFQFDADYTVAAGYETAIANPWRFAGNGPYEQIRAKDGTLVYEGEALRSAHVSVQTTSAPFHGAKNGHYFMESDKVRFTVETYFRDRDWSEGEISLAPRFTSVYGEPLTNGAFFFRRTGAQALPGGIRRVTHELELTENPRCGVWHLEINCRAGAGEAEDRRTVFEVISDDPEGPCPPLASKLPFLVSMPNEVKFLEESSFDPDAEFGGCVPHYYAAAELYPAVGNSRRIWERLKPFRRKWFCWSWKRNTDDLDMYDDFNMGLMRHADVFGGFDNRTGYRYERGVMSYYKNDLLRALRDFVKERRPPLKRLTAERMDALVARDEPISYDDLRDVFETCWNEWLEYSGPRFAKNTQAFVEHVLAQNPKVAFGSYGPYGLYVSAYKTPYQFRYSGYSLERDPRVRANGSFWLFEEYHFSCDYPLSRTALFVAGYDLLCGFSRKIYPEIYYSAWGRCNDGAVFQAHPVERPPLATTHQRRIVYQYTYGTPHFKDGEFGFWRDYGFHARNPERDTMDEFIYAWGRMIRNEPSRPLKAPFLFLDCDALARHGEYFDDETNSLFHRGTSPRADICNTGEEALAYAYERCCAEGYASPVVTTFADLDRVTPEIAEFAVLPPIEKGTPPETLSAIRRLAERGVSLLAFEAVEGLEDLFGVKAASGGARKVGWLPGESFSHKMAKGRYAADGADVLLWGAERAGAAADVPAAMAKGRNVFFNVPPTSMRRCTLRENYHWGTDALSENVRGAMRTAFARLAPAPAVKSDIGGICAAYTVNGDVVAVIYDDSPIYNDRKTYPRPVKFAVSAPGIGGMSLDADAPWKIVENDGDRVVVRTETAKDTALFFKFGNKSKGK